MFESKSLLNMKIFWHALVCAATLSLRGSGVYILCRSVLLQRLRGFQMACKDMKEIKVAGCQGNGTQINHLCPHIAHM